MIPNTFDVESLEHSGAHPLPGFLLARALMPIKHCERQTVTITVMLARRERRRCS